MRTNQYVRLTWLIRLASCILVGSALAFSLDAADPDRSKDDRLARSRLFDDMHLAENVMAVRRHATELPPDERYEYLANWVLPSRDHATFRLNGMFGQMNPPPPVADYAKDEQERLDRSVGNMSGRIQTGGTLLAPALDLINVAKQLGRLDVLRRRVEAGMREGDVSDQKRGQLALLILIDVAHDDFKAAQPRLEEFDRLAAGSPFLADERWPELLVFYEAMRHRQTYSFVGESVSTVIDREVRGSGDTGSVVFDRHLLALSGIKRHFDDGHTSIDAYLDDAPAKQWAPVSRVSAKTRGQGMPVARWRVFGKSALSYAGHDNDFLYFQSPLRGDYELDCQLTFFGWRATQLMVGGRWVSPVYGMRQFDLGGFRGGHGRHVLDPPMWNRTELDIHCRVVVKDRVATTFFNGRKIHEEPLGEEHDPWVGIRSEHNRFGGVRDLRISGNPTILPKLKLLHNAALTGWVPYYHESIGGVDSDWRLDEGELVGRARSDLNGETRESLIYYHRPMLEDGSIEYEFFYQPNESVIYPALDRLVFLLQPEGVQVHWCTDGDYDRTRLPVSNVYDEPDNRHGPSALPLKPGLWNGMKLTLAGKTVRLHLNGELIYQRDLELSNLRQFGLFHYCDRTASRVRNIVWRGNWPRILPPLEEQELADVSLVKQLESNWAQMDVFEHDFAKDGMPSEVFQLESTQSKENASTAFVHRPDGIHVTRSGTVPKGWRAYKIEHRFRLLGDFDITAAFDQLEMTLPVGNEHNGVGFNVLLDCDPSIRIWLRLLRNGADHRFVGTTSQHRRSDGGIRWDYWKNLPSSSLSGTLRLVRRGKTIYYFFADGDSTQFRLHRKQELSDSPVQMNGLKLLTQATGIGQTSVVWKRVTIRADQIIPDPAANRKSD